MKKLKITTAFLAFLAIISCEKEKIDVKEIEGYIFSYDPKNSSKNNAIDAVLSVINRGLESAAAENNEKSYVGFGIKDKNGNIETSKIKNTEYMLIFNQQEFDKVIANANLYGQKPKNSINFSQEFVFVLIHPSKFTSGLQFFDGLDAQVEDENIMKIKPNFTELPYIQNENPIYNYGENDYQVHQFKIPKSKFQTIIIEWETGEIETIKIRK